MPSPFPGMDPYLEGSEWTSFHLELSSEIARQLAPKLRPKYIVRTARRFVTEMPDDVIIATADIYPDVNVVQSDHQGQSTTTKAPTPTETTPLQLATVMPARIPHVTVEIRDVAQRELITAIEILSPTNKRGEGYQEYLEKRRRLLHSTTHLVEIDLLRKGQRVPMQQALPPAPYFIFVSRAETRPIIDVWPIPLLSPLPAINIPLQSAGEMVVLEMQLAFNTIYDALNYDLSLNYKASPEVPFDAAMAEQVTRYLQNVGIDQVSE